MLLTKCPLCKMEYEDMGKITNDEKGKKYFCPNCGVYYILPELESKLLSHQFNETEKELLSKLYLLSGYVREKSDNGNCLSLKNMDTIKVILNSAPIPKATIQRLNKLLVSIYNQNLPIGTVRTVIKPEPNSNNTAFVSDAMGYARDRNELVSMLASLRKNDYIFTPNESGKIYDTSDFQCFDLTIEGMAKAEQLLSSSDASKTQVFVAMRFEESLIKEVMAAIDPACNDLGFNPLIMSRHEHNNDITDEIIAGIKQSRFMIADLTYNNLGAYYEAGFARGFGIPVVHTCKKEWLDAKDDRGEKNRLHFDVDHINLIIWDDSSDLESRLKNRILATIL